MIGDRTESRTNRTTRGVRVALVTFAVSLGTLSGCDTLLEVELPASITEDALDNPGAVPLLVSSVISHFECAYSSFTYEESGRSDTWDRLAGAGAGAGGETYRSDGRAGSCDTGLEAYTWYQPFQISRSIAYETYDKLDTQWTTGVPNRERSMATVALYAGATMGVFGEFFCEFTVDNGPLMTQDQTLESAEDWIDTALGHIGSTGDFALSHGATESIETLAYGLRARIRWARGPAHWDGAMEDLLRVPQGYQSWVTRDTGNQRANKMYLMGPFVGFGHVTGPFTHWDGPPNPVTGQDWPNPIPFTGYLDLGILPDGRAISEDQYPITMTEHASALEDHRVRTRVQSVQGPIPGPVPISVYEAEADDIPLVSWRELWLIRAEIEGGQEAIDLVNEVRDFRDLPLVTYADPGDAEQILDMIIEERRRDLWLQARFWSTKIQNTDRLWFPRAFGVSELQSFVYGGGVTMHMPNDEFELNPNLVLQDRGTGCPESRAPTLVD